jgi:hypothetical protein
MTALHLHATTRYYALPGLSPTRPNYHQGEGVLHDRRGDRKTVEVVYWPGADGFKRGATFYSRETRPGCKGGVPAEGGAAAEWLDEGAVIAYTRAPARTATASPAASSARSGPARAGGGWGEGEGRR